jgi:fumarate reductase iron-sulfur subunit
MEVIVCNKSYTIENKVDNLLSILVKIKSIDNNSLAFRSGCRSGVCGSCAVVVNGIEKLACRVNIKDKDNVEPLRNLKIIRDLVVDNLFQSRLLIDTNSQLQQLSNNSISANDEKK